MKFTMHGIALIISLSMLLVGCTEITSQEQSETTSEPDNVDTPGPTVEDTQTPTSENTKSEELPPAFPSTP